MGSKMNTTSQRHQVVILRLFKALGASHRNTCPTPEELWRDASGIPCLLLSVFSRHPLSGIGGSWGRMPLCEANAIPTSTSKAESSVMFIKSYCIHHTVHTALCRFKRDRAWRGAQRNGGTQSACDMNCYNMQSLYAISENTEAYSHLKQVKSTQSAKLGVTDTAVTTGYYWLMPHLEISEVSRIPSKSILTYQYCQAKNVANRNPQKGDNWAYL